jgi:ribosomal protein S18 acetylase RimI-like enzyme
MTIRYAKQEDLAKVINIEKLSFSHPWDHEFIETLSKEIFLIFGEEDVYGFLIAGCCYRNISATVLKIAVHPDYRRRGIATNLLCKLFEILKDKQIADIDVVVEVIWEPAIALYKKVGFKVASRIPLAPDSNDFYIMKYKLKEN